MASIINKSYSDLLKMSKEKIDAAMAPIRARAAKAKADQKLAEIDGKLIDIDRQLAEACLEKEINYDKLADLADEKALLEHRKATIQEIVDTLFPE